MTELDRKIKETLFPDETENYSYSTNLEAAWLVVRKMNSECWHMVITRHTVTISDGDFLHREDFLDTPSKSICLAALAAVERGVTLTLKTLTQE